MADFDDFTESEFDAEFGDYDGPVYLLGVRADQPICDGKSRCAEISKEKLEKALGRDLEAKPMQTSTSTVTWK